MQTTNLNNPSQPSEPVFFTIGYQQHSIQSLIGRLQGNFVEVLVDVRANAVSRKAGFSKSRLRDAVTSAGIEYMHAPELGTPAEIRIAYRRSGNAPLALQEYKRYLSSREGVIQALAATASGKKVCLFCLESDHTLCHRGIIAQKLGELTRWQPIHLI